MPAGIDLSDPVSGFAKVAARMTHRDGLPLVVLVDDLHALDTTSALLLRRLVESRVVWLLATLRTGESPAPAVQALCDVRRVRRMEMEVFTREETERLVEAVLELPVALNTLERLHGTSGGNALFLRELVIGAVTRGALVNDGELWRPTGTHGSGTERLSDLVGARLAAAGPAARPVLELAALCRASVTGRRRPRGRDRRARGRRSAPAPGRRTTPVGGAGTPSVRRDPPRHDAGAPPP